MLLNLAFGAIVKKNMANEKADNKPAEKCCCADWRSPKTALFLIGMILLFGVIIASILRDRIVNKEYREIGIAGHAKISYKPDIADINMGVQVDKTEKAEEALAQLDGKMKKIIDAVQAAGISKDDILTQNYTLFPHYDTVGNIAKRTGYDANQIIIIKVRGINNKPEVISKVVSNASKAGVNQINGIIFEASDLNSIKQEARLRAIADARAKAGKIARALGVRLGRVSGWWENILPMDSAQSDMGIGGGGGGAAPVITVGQQEISADVNINYKIK